MSMLLPTTGPLESTHFIAPFTNLNLQREHGPLVMREARGMRLWDKQGREYLDAMAGLWCVNIGYGREEMVRAIADQTQKLCYYHSFMNMATEPTIELVDKLAPLLPAGLNKMFFGNSGSDANDTNAKIVWHYFNLLGKPEKKKIIARKGGYHGVTVASGSMTGLPPVHLHFDLPAGGRFLHTDRPHHYWDAPAGMGEEAFSAHLAERLEAQIIEEGPETIAAFIAEPLQGAGGVIVPPKGYFEAIVPVLKKHDILFIADEVICGFGRLGTWWGSDYYNIQPDIITLAKGLTSGYVPMSASVVSDAIWDVLDQGSRELGVFAHGFTYSAHPLGAAAAITCLDIMQRDNLVANAAKVGAYLQRRLEEAFVDHPLVGQKRGVGNVAAIELVKDKANKTPFELSDKVAVRMAGLLLREGLICRPIGNALVFSPSHIITEEIVEEMVEKFTRALGTLVEQLRAEGIWQG